jgi:hypothetical protein
MYLLVSQHVSGIIMPIIRITVKKADNAYGVQPWPCCSRLEEKRWFGVHLLGLVSTNPNKCTPNHLFSSSLLHTIRVVGFVLFSWWWAWWCQKHVETPINTSSFLLLVGYLFTFMIQDARSHEIKITRTFSCSCGGIFYKEFHIRCFRIVKTIKY